LKKHILILLALLAFASSAFGQAFSNTGTTQLRLEVLTGLQIRIDTSITDLTNAGVFTDYAGTTNYTYKVRLGASNTGTITLQTTNFTAGGPNLGGGDTLSYSCGATTGPAVACSGPIAASTSTTTNVASFAANSRHNNGTGSVVWALPDNPTWTPTTHTATVTFNAAVL
jgi:hypothetical protein